MRKLLAVSATGLGLILAQPVLTSAQTPDGVVELSGGSVAAGIGYSWGNGSLIFRGQRYALN